MKKVLIMADLIRDERVWIESGEYELVRLTPKGYLINVNGELYNKRVVAQIPFNEGEVCESEDEQF